MSHAATWTAALVITVAFGALAVDDGPDDIVTAQLVADEVADLERQPHPSTTQPARKRHASVQGEQ